MASIGKDDLFDEEIVAIYLKEVTFITITIFIFVSHNTEKENKEKEQENKQGPRVPSCYRPG